MDPFPAPTKRLSHWLLLLLTGIGFQLVPVNLSAQSLTQTITGQVLDKETLRPLAGATVILTDLPEGQSPDPKSRPSQPPSASKQSEPADSGRLKNRERSQADSSRRSPPKIQKASPTASPRHGAITDAKGYFRLPDIPVGRHSLRVTFPGYEPATLSEVMLTSGRPLNLSIEMETAYAEVTLDKSVLITADKDKTSPLNEMATVSARKFRVQETSKYAGSWGDPARMTAFFAGVSANQDERNDIVVRGNSPSGVLFRLEGVEIPNPNHYANSGTSGGGISILNSNTLGNADFFTGAFPAEYGNASAAVFDLRLRKGNTEKAEYLFQAGPNGLEIGGEGPLKKGKQASWMAHYRVISLTLLERLGFAQWIGGVPNYQDLNFKIHVPLKQGSLDLFGVGGTSSITFPAGDTTGEYGSERLSIEETAGSKMGATGLRYTLLIGENSWLRAIVSVSGTQTRFTEDSITTGEAPLPVTDVNLSEGRGIGSLTWSFKPDRRNTIRLGGIFNLPWYRQRILRYDYSGPNHHSRWAYSGNTQRYQAYAQWKYRLTAQLTLNTGAHFLHLGLGKQTALSPRAGLNWQASPRYRLSLGYGRHHRMLAPGIYFGYQVPNGVNPQNGIPAENTLPNTALPFLQSDHFVLEHAVRIRKNLNLKLEAYYQALGQVPVSVTPGSFSGLNVGADFDNVIVYEKLEGKGTGYNYGLEATLEKFFANQYYFLITSSLFDSRYRGSDGVLRNTAFNSNFILNALGGKEFSIGENNILGLNASFVLTGGRWQTPVDLVASRREGQTVLIDSLAYSERVPAYFRPDFRISFRQNLPRISHQLAVDIKNVINRRNVFRRFYDRGSNSIGYTYNMGLFPMAFYSLEF